MNFISTYKTDIGRKYTNQDGLLIKEANSARGKIGLFAICDGMGGLEKGELASSTVINSMSVWFEEVLPNLLNNKNICESIKISLINCIESENKKISSYGKSFGIQLGTTVTAMIIIDDEYIVIHVGDSRIYLICDKLVQITKDQSFVQREVDRGNISMKEAKTHPNKNVLLECVGITPNVNVLTYRGKIKNDEIYLICSDGFYNMLSEDELLEKLNKNRVVNESQMKDASYELVELVKEREEVDNISMVVIKIV
ncbi:MAG: PP2C family protein-serine/threonine phosphatase [Peptostreptococcaceae bacterium]